MIKIMMKAFQTEGQDMSEKSKLTKEAGGVKPSKPAKHIEETARLASSVEPDKNPEKVRKAKD